MFDDNDSWNRSGRIVGGEAEARGVAQEVDAGLRSHMIRVYNYMGIGLGITGIVAYLSAPFLASLFISGSPLVFVLMFAPLGIVLFLSFGINKMSFATAQMMFWGYAFLMGLSLSSIFLSFALGDIARAFFIAASMFGAMSLYGYTTRKDLTGMGSFLFMGVIGLIIASVVNMFLHSSGLQFIVSILGVLIFTGLTAYDTQKIKEIYYSADSQEVAGKKAVIGALSLYIDFINIFIHLLQLLGRRD